ncbi:hypothetical protein KA082_01695 [Candidatus Woesebacteria bacterium]|nr:hypothetical protein [Candidatus Woesebacteria bacterium]
MSKRSAILSFVYALFQITEGMLLHPYQTVQSLAREKVFSWMIFLPAVVYVLAKIIWFYILVPTVRYVFSCHTTSFWGCDLIPFFADWLVFFCLYWQVLLLYLLIRFWIAFDKN